jgi:hypothetical protein
LNQWVVEDWPEIFIHRESENFLTAVQKRCYSGIATILQTAPVPALLACITCWNPAKKSGWTGNW